MNRRDLMKRIVGVSAFAGTSVQVSTVSAATPEDSSGKPAVAVIECEQPLSQETASRLQAGLEHALENTPFKGLKVIVLGDGLHMTFLDAHGRILNERLDPHSVTITREPPTEAGEVCSACGAVYAQGDWGVHHLLRHTGAAKG